MLDRKVRSALSRVIAVGSYKGGVGKTATTANLAGLFARDGHRVLVVDLDDQGDQQTLLGYYGTDTADGGRGVLQSFVDGVPFKPKTVPSGRVDVLAGGDAIEQLELMLINGDDDVYERFAQLLAPIAPEYDVIFLDCPPKSRSLLRMAMLSARYLLIPVRPDENSLTGIERLAATIQLVRGDNPKLEAVGVVAFDFDRQATSHLGDTRETVTEILGEGMLFDSFIGHATGVSIAEQRRGEGAWSLAQAAKAQEPWWKLRGRGERVRRLPEAAARVAQDYQGIYAELVERIRTRDAGFAPRFALEEIDHD